ncbi:amino acid transporter avt3b [Quercus suber]|uniref:Amino acid transporter avt3b n=1 Tax=Quercus suber TaxID=58331 RepID=A0AAW0LCI0_QUESU
MGFEAGSSSNALKAPSPPREDTPLLGHSPQALSSQAKTFANVFIAIVGAGVLGLPYSFKRTAPLSIFADVVDLGAIGVVMVEDVGWDGFAFESEMKDKDKFGKVLALTMAFIALIYEIVERRFWGGSYCLWLRWLLVVLVFRSEIGWKGWTLDVGIMLLGIVLGVSGTCSGTSLLLHNLSHKGLIDVFKFKLSICDDASAT